MKVTRRRALRLILAAVIAAVGVSLVWTEVIDLHAAQEWMQSLNPVLLIALMAILPLFGFSVSVVYLVAGAAFGGIGGTVVVIGVTAGHLLGSHWLGKFLRNPVERLLKAKKIHVPAIPEGEERALTVVAALTPGPPYFVRNYVLALSGIPLRVYFWICWPIYVLRSFIVIFLGDVGADLTVERVVILAGVFLAKISICGLIVYRMRQRYKATHPHHPRRTLAANLQG